MNPFAPIKNKHQGNNGKGNRKQKPWTDPGSKFQVGGYYRRLGDVLKDSTIVHVEVIVKDGDGNCRDSSSTNKDNTKDNTLVTHLM